MVSVKQNRSSRLWSAEARVLVGPAATFRALADAPPGAAPLSRPALLLLFLGCAVSFLASGTPNVRLIVDGAISFAFVPICETAGLAASIRFGHRRVPFARAIDVFFAGNAPWLAWCVVVAAATTLTRPILWTPPIIVASAVVPVVWSMLVDYHFFREVTGATASDAVRATLVQRAVAWTLATAYFFGIAIWPQVAGRLGW